MELSTWSPFQSTQVREICRHMTEAERARGITRGALYGVWVAATVAAPMSFAWGSATRARWVLAVSLLIVHVVCIPLWQKRVRRFLCSTAWAREHGLAAESLPLFRFRI